MLEKERKHKEGERGRGRCKEEKQGERETAGTPGKEEIKKVRR